MVYPQSPFDFLGRQHSGRLRRLPAVVTTPYRKELSHETPSFCHDPVPLCHLLGDGTGPPRLLKPAAPEVIASADRRRSDLTARSSRLDGRNVGRCGRGRHHRHRLFMDQKPQVPQAIVQGQDRRGSDPWKGISLSAGIPLPVRSDPGPSTPKAELEKDAGFGTATAGW